MQTIETTLGPISVQLDGEDRAWVGTNGDQSVILFGVEYHGSVRFERHGDGFHLVRDQYGHDYHATHLSRVKWKGHRNDASQAAKRKFAEVATVALNTWAGSNPEALDVAARAKFEQEMGKLEESIAEHQSAILELGAEMDRLTKEEGARNNR